MSNSAKYSWWIILKVDLLNGFQSFEKLNHLRNDIILGNRKRPFQLLLTIVSKKKPQNTIKTFSSFFIWKSWRKRHLPFSTQAQQLHSFFHLFKTCSFLCLLFYHLFSYCFSPLFSFIPFHHPSHCRNNQLLFLCSFVSEAIIMNIIMTIVVIITSSCPSWPSLPSSYQLLLPSAGIREVGLENADLLKFSLSAILSRDLEKKILRWLSLSFLKIILNIG